MKKNLIIMALAAAAVFGLAACGGDKAPAAANQGDVLVIQNETGEDLNEMVISAASEESDWEETNHFEGKVVKSGDSFPVPKSIFTKNENYDLSFGSTKGTIYSVWEIDVKNVKSVTVTKDDVGNEETEE